MPNDYTDWFTQAPLTSSLQQSQALTKYLPTIMSAINSQTLPTAQSNLYAQQQISDPQNALMLQLYQKYGPQMAQVGNEIARQNANYNTQTQSQLMQGAGTDYLKSAYNASQIFDAPYYQTRQTTADQLNRLFNSIDLSGALSGSERDEITKGLARQNIQAGTYNSPSQTNTVANAMRYGQANYQRQQQAKSNLSSALQQASTFLPQARSGVNVFGVGQNNMSQGSGQYQGLASLPTSQNSFGSSLMGNQANAFNTGLGIAGNLTNSYTNNMAAEEARNTPGAIMGDVQKGVSAAASLLGGFI